VLKLFSLFKKHPVKKHHYLLRQSRMIEGFQTQFNTPF